jgi:ubiquinone/menaquinone biosynthesis C-methylase UbiE
VVPAPLEIAAEVSEAPAALEESILESVAADATAVTPEPVAIEELVASEEFVAPEVPNAVEESAAAGSPPIESSATETTVAEIQVTDAGSLGVTALGPEEIDDIVAEISARIHSLEPVAAETSPAKTAPAETIGGTTAEDESELIEWETLDPSASETPTTSVVTDEAPIAAEPASESHAVEFLAEESSVAEEISESVESDVQDAALLDDLSAEPSVDDAALVELTASEVAIETAPEEAPAVDTSANEVPHAALALETQPSSADAPIAEEDLHDDLAQVAEVSVVATEPAPGDTVVPEEATVVESVEQASDAREKDISVDSGLLDLPRVAEPEVMDDAVEVEAYASAAAQEWLNSIDASFIEHAARLVKERQRGRALDIGTGPGQITLKLALRLSLWKFTGVDRSQKMIDEALANMAAIVPVTGRLEFQLADGNRLDYPDASFDLVVCNSVLHHFAEPQNLLAEMARVVKPRGAILLRDLRRPSRLEYPFHVRWHGRRYTGTMNKLYRDSVRAAYTVPELQRLLTASPLRGARVFKHGSTHIGIERVYNW